MSIGEKVAGGAAWSIVMNIGSRVVSVCGTLLLTRYMDPKEYGEVMGAAVIAGTALAVTNLGLAPYMVSRKDLAEDAPFHVTVLSLTTAITALGLAILLGHRLGPYFQVEQLPRFLPGLALVALLDRTEGIAERFLYRQLRFKMLGTLSAVCEITYTATSLALVMTGMGGMAIVWANIARSSLKLVVVVRAVGFRVWLEPHRLRLSRFREILSWGVRISVSGVASYLSRRWDNMLLSRFFGARVMGSYNLAYNLADLPAVQIGEQIGDVLLPSLAQMKAEDRPRAFVRATRLLALVMFPVAVGLGATAETLVQLFLDPKWSGVAPMLTLLSALSLTRPIGYTVGALLQTTGRPFTVSLLEIFKVLALFVSMITLGRLGPLWVCGAVGLAFGAHAVLGLFIVRGEGVPFLRTLLSLTRPLLACIPLSIAAVGTRWLLLRAGTPLPLILAAQILAGILAYVGAAFVIANDATTEIITLFRAVLARRRGEPRPG